MNILVINGDCIQTNTSANLCHIAYIKGLVDAGHDVTLLSADGKDYVLDSSIKIPENVKQYTYYGVSLYEKLSLKKKSSPSAPPAAEAASISDTSKPSGGLKAKLISKAKKIILSFYGVHTTYAKFVKKAAKFRCDTEFDYVLSISTPVTSHLLAHNLLKSKHIHAKHWIQIWEDPWFSDTYFARDQKVFEEEKRLLSFAEKVCYVSPLTLKNQQKLFPESADKMYWQPLPYYYKGTPIAEKSFEENHYGYFGDYAPASRDLKPFYEAALQTGIQVNICGRPDNLFASVGNVHIHPRLPLDELKPIEDNTNVLIFLCNRKGGQIPGKIYQYSATNKIILFILDGTDEEKQVIKDYFEPLNRYIFCENTVEDISKAIRLIESDDFGNVENKPLDCFNPVDTITKILEGC